MIWKVSLDKWMIIRDLISIVTTTLVVAVVISSASEIGSTFGPTTPLTRSIAVVTIRHRQQLRMNILFWLLQHFYEIWRLLLIFVGKERVSNTLVVSTTGSTDAMHIILAAVRIIEIDHVLNVFNVYKYIIQLM